MATTRLGFDLGGTKIEVLAATADGVELIRERRPTPGHDYDAIVAALCEEVASVEARLGPVQCVGIGMPGAMSPATGTVKNSNTLVLNGRPFLDDMSRALGRPVCIENDANCFALSEAVDGAGASHRLVFGVILGTGVGGGIVFDRAVWRGRNAIAGEWGHVALPSALRQEGGGRRCYCGRIDCIETWLSGPALLAEYRTRGGTAANVAGIVEHARSGEPLARETMARFYERLAEALAIVVNILDPDAVVIGGGLSNIDEIYELVPGLLARHVVSDAVTTPVLRNRHGDSSGVRGAAWLCPANPPPARL